MKQVSSLRSQLAAAMSALALSVVLISSTVSMPHTAQLAGSAYVGALA
jgi:hypothetical protein